MYRHIRIVGPYLIALLSVITGCSEKRMSPDELIAAMQAEGYKVVREAKIHHSVRGADVAFWLRIDGVRVAAWQFDSPFKAEMAITTMARGLYINHWAFEHVDEITAEKIRRALK